MSHNTPPQQGNQFERLNDLHQAAQVQYQTLKRRSVNRIWLLISLVGIASFLGLSISIFSRLTILNQNQTLREHWLYFSRMFSDGLVSSVAYVTPTAPIPTLEIISPQPENETTGILPSGSVIFIPWVSHPPKICAKTEETKIEVISGPLLSPKKGSRFSSGNAPTAKATWVIKNVSDCSWRDLSLYSLSNGSTIDPTFHRGGETWAGYSDQVLAYPGEILEVTANFKPIDAKDIKDEWVLVINQGQLFSSPHISLNVKAWIIMNRPLVRTPAAGPYIPSTAVPTSPGSSGPTRSAPTSPPRVTTPSP